MIIFLIDIQVKDLDRLLYWCINQFGKNFQISFSEPPEEIRNLYEQNRNS